MATKNNLDVGGEAPHHTELSDRYRIGDGVYDLTQIVAAVKGEQSNDDWNGRTMGDRLDAIKGYLKDQEAEKVSDDENTAGDGETVRDGNGNILEHPAQIAGSDGNDAGGTGTATAVQGDTMSDEDKEAVELVRAGKAAQGPVETLRAFKQEDEAKEVEDILSSNERLSDTIAGVREKLGITDETASIAEAVDELQTKLRETEDRATLAEQDNNALRREAESLRQRVTRDAPLHGAVEELKAPY